jgi:hypothetical protein
MTEKSLKDRLDEVINLYKQLQQLGLHSHIEGIHSFQTLANEFVKSGVPQTGEIPLEGTKRILCYKLSNKKHVISDIVLRHAPHV